MSTFKSLDQLSLHETQVKRIESLIEERQASSDSVLPQGFNAPKGGYVPEADPLITKLHEIKFVETVIDALPYGLYLAHAAPGRGKSITTLALAFWQNAAASSNKTPGKGVALSARYVPLGEPRAIVTGLDGDIANQVSTFPTTVPNLFGVHNGKQVGIAVIDSVSYAMRSFPGTGVATRGKTGTMSGGMEVADQEWCRLVQQAALKNGVLIGLISTADVPFYASLEGLVEGFIEVVGPGSFKIKYRGLSSRGTRARDDSEVLTLPAWSIHAAAYHLGYSATPAEPDPVDVSLPGSTSSAFNPLLRYTR